MAWDEVVAFRGLLIDPGESKISYGSLLKFTRQSPIPWDQLEGGRKRRDIPEC